MQCFFSGSGDRNGGTERCKKNQWKKGTLAWLEQQIRFFVGRWRKFGFWSYCRFKCIVWFWQHRVGLASYGPLASHDGVVSVGTTFCMARNNQRQLRPYFDLLRILAPHRGRGHTVASHRCIWPFACTCLRLLFTMMTETNDKMSAETNDKMSETNDKNNASTPSRTYGATKKLGQSDQTATSPSGVNNVLSKVRKQVVF